MILSFIIPCHCNNPFLASSIVGLISPDTLDDCNAGTTVLLALPNSLDASPVNRGDEKGITHKTDKLPDPKVYAAAEAGTTLLIPLLVQ